MSPSSIPQAPAQPNAPIYPISSLFLFQTYTRDSFKAAFGIDAPDEDPTRPEQDWFDSTASTPTAYNYFDPASGTMKQEVIQAPGAINLPGLKAYPKYTIAPTDATWGPNGTGVSPANLCLESEVQALVAEFKNSDPNASYQQAFSTGAFQIVYPADEPRRYWNIVYKGQSLVAAAFVQEMNAAGVGAPGQWDFSGAEPNWISAVPSSIPTLAPPLPMPCRQLLPNERIVPGVLPGTWQIQRTDMPSPVPAPASGGLTADQANDVTACRTMLQNLSRVFGQPAL